MDQFVLGCQNKIPILDFFLPIRGKCRVFGNYNLPFCDWMITQQAIAYLKILGR
ncbi:hypothetical protein [Nostoc sp.]|uniref:hypothetical protein n=1 Tax=Nostoc sp. TaxID=1180 RepID=UPI0039C94844